MKRVIIVSPSSDYLGGKANFTDIIFKVLKNSINFKINLLNVKSSNIRKDASTNIGSYRDAFSNSFKRAKQVFSNFVFNKLRLIFKIIIFQPSIVQLHSSSYFNFWDNYLYFLIAKLFRKKIVIRLGGGAFDFFCNTSSKPTKFLIKVLLNNVNHIIIQSNYWKKFLVKTNIKSRMTIIPNFVDCNYWQSPVEQHNNTSNDYFDILFMVGSAVKRKGYYDVMPVFEELIKNGYKLRLHLVALGCDIENKYEYLIEKGHLVFYDHIKSKEKLSLYRSCDLFLLPTYSEGFPNTLLEAMAAGLPIITSNIPQIKAFLKEDNAFFVSPGNKLEIKKSIIRAYESPKEMECLVKHSLEKIRKDFDVINIEDYFKTIYNSL